MSDYINLKNKRMTLDDMVLVEQAKGGDASALENLIRKYQNRIFNVILKISGNYEDAAELTQETFVKVIESIDTFKGKSRFYTWLYRIAVNLTINYCKRAVKLGFRSLDQNKGNLTDENKRYLKDILTNSSAEEPSTSVQNKEINEIVMQSIMKLDDDQRAVLVLREFEDMSYDQIAEVLGIELGTVKSRLSRARNNLKEILEMIL